MRSSAKLRVLQSSVRQSIPWSFERVSFLRSTKEFTCKFRLCNGCLFVMSLCRVNMDANTNKYIGNNHFYTRSVPPPSFHTIQCCKQAKWQSKAQKRWTNGSIITVCIPWGGILIKRMSTHKKREVERIESNAGTSFSLDNKHHCTLTRIHFTSFSYPILSHRLTNKWLLSCFNRQTKVLPKCEQCK